MSSLSRRNAGQGLVKPPVRAYVAAYGLWSLTFLVGLIVAFALRDVFQMAMVFTTLDRYAVHLFNQSSVVLLVVLLLVLLVVTEAYYRNGVPHRQLGRRFARVAGLLALVLAGVQGVRLVLEINAGAINLLSVLILVATLLVYGGARVVVQRSTQGPAAGMRSRALTGRIAIAAALVAGAVLLVLPIKHPVNPYDEGLALVGGLACIGR